MTPIDQSIGPGFVGFLATFALTLMVILLMRSLTGHLRKVRRDERALAAVDGDAGGDVVADEARKS